jgi:F-type H+-transporting ATPase subunit epsilon
MAREFRLSVVAPDRTVYEGMVTSVVAPGIMAGHEPSIIALKPGLVEFSNANGEKTFVATMGGFLEVSHDKCIILADEAQVSADISVEAAEQQLERARRALRGEDSDMSTDEATEEIQRAMVRLKAARMK